ncbi:MAG: M28 family peptidase [Myxococcales bacterium]|nr:M28 family peptidase [Myxococcales bacterium]
MKTLFITNLSLKRRALPLFTLLSLFAAACGGSSTATDSSTPVIDAQVREPSSASAAALEATVRLLSEDRVPRDHAHPQTLDEIANHIQAEFEGFGLTAEQQTFEVGTTTYRNVSAMVGPASATRIVVGAHYDAAGELPGADDNASGVAGLLELARILSNQSDLAIQIEFVAYSLEEPPYFSTADMGSARHAATVTLAEVQLMISLEMLGYFTDSPGSQQYPEIPGLPPGYLTEQFGDVGNYIALVGRPEEQNILTRMEDTMGASSSLGVKSLAVPSTVQGVAWSDHLNYWDQNIPALMVTDTAFYRNEQYHEAGDTWDRLDYVRMGQVVNGLRDAIVSLGADPL